MFSRSEAEMERQYAEAIVKMKTPANFEEVKDQEPDDLNAVEKKSIFSTLATFLRSIAPKSK